MGRPTRSLSFNFGLTRSNSFNRGIFGGNRRKSLLTQCSSNDATMMNIFASDMVSTRYILAQIKGIQTNRKIVRIELEDLMERGEPATDILDELLDLVTDPQDKRPWERLQCTDTILYDSLALWQQHHQTVLQQFEESLQQHSPTKTQDNDDDSAILPGNAIALTFCANLEVPTGTAKSSVQDLLQLLLRDTTISSMEYTGALYGVVDARIPEVFHQLFQPSAEDAELELTQNVRISLIYKQQHQQQDQEHSWSHTIQACLKELEKEPTADQPTPKQGTKIIIDADFDFLGIASEDDHGETGTVRSRRSIKSSKSNKSRRSSKSHNHKSTKERRRSSKSNNLSLGEHFSRQAMNDSSTMSIDLDELSALTPHTHHNNDHGSITSHGQSEAPSYNWTLHESNNGKSFTELAPARIPRRTLHRASSFRHMAVAGDDEGGDVTNRKLLPARSKSSDLSQMRQATHGRTTTSSGDAKSTTSISPRRRCPPRTMSEGRPALRRGKKPILETSSCHDKPPSAPKRSSGHEESSLSSRRATPGRSKSADLAQMRMVAIQKKQKAKQQQLDDDASESTEDGSSIMSKTSTTKSSSSSSSKKKKAMPRRSKTEVDCTSSSKRVSGMNIKEWKEENKTVPCAA